MNDAEAAFLDVMREKLTGKENAGELIETAAHVGEILGLPLNSIRIVAEFLIKQYENGSPEHPAHSENEVSLNNEVATNSSIAPEAVSHHLLAPDAAENSPSSSPKPSASPEPPDKSNFPSATSGNAALSHTTRQNDAPQPPASPATTESNPNWIGDIQSEPKPLKLLVDWGQELCIGHQACPSFTLHGLEPTSPQPIVEVQIDERLDHQRNTEKPRLTPGEAGLWQFDAPFALTTAGADCRPGRYRLEIRVVQQSSGRTPAQCYICTLRLKVGEPGSVGGPSLEIEGDGQSVVNVQGSDLSGFANVKFKGADTSVLNFQAGQAFQPAEQPITPTHSDESNSKLCEYRFSIDEQRQAMLPKVSSRFISRFHLRSAALQFENGDQILLISKANVFFGRAKTNDIATRFLPRSTANDRLTRDISRQHVSIRMSEDGVHIADLGSTKGVSIDGVRIENACLLSNKQADEEMELLLAGIPSPNAMGFEMKMFSVPHEHDRDQAGCGEWRDLLCCDAAKVRQPKAWRLAQASGIDAVRLRRTRNLANQEQYILVGRQAIIGYSEDAAIYIPDSRVHRNHARIL
ncbi:MAG: FHA domain-containing protein, partial [Rubripirellula sp.]